MKMRDMTDNNAGLASDIIMIDIPGVEAESDGSVLFCSVSTNHYQSQQQADTCCSCTNK